MTTYFDEELAYRLQVFRGQACSQVMQQAMFWIFDLEGPWPCNALRDWDNRLQAYAGTRYVSFWRVPAGHDTRCGALFTHDGYGAFTGQLWPTNCSSRPWLTQRVISWWGC